LRIYRDTGTDTNKVTVSDTDRPLQVEPRAWRSLAAPRRPGLRKRSRTRWGCWGVDGSGRKKGVLDSQCGMRAVLFVYAKVESISHTGLRTSRKISCRSSLGSESVKLSMRQRLGGLGTAAMGMRRHINGLYTSASPHLLHMHFTYARVGDSTRCRPPPAATQSRCRSPSPAHCASSWPGPVCVYVRVCGSTMMRSG
jgi:hypothetical protein